jgi:hypothetical protein
MIFVSTHFQVFQLNTMRYCHFIVIEATLLQVCLKIKYLRGNRFKCIRNSLAKNKRYLETLCKQYCIRLYT